MDTLLTILICFTQGVLGFLGVFVSLRPPSPGHQSRWMIGFILIVFVGVGLTGWLAKRSGNTQTAATAEVSLLKEEIAHVHIHTVIGQYAVDDPTRLPIGWKPLMEGHEAAFRLYFANSSDTSEANQVGAAGELFVVAKQPDLGAYFAEVRKQFKTGWTGETLGAHDGRFISVKSQPLSRADAGGIADGTRGIYLVAIIQFSDSTGSYEQDVCKWLQPRTMDVWHGCPVKYENERKH